jgi:O-antigen/teichoic acid export membrane protein
MMASRSEARLASDESPARRRSLTFDVTVTFGARASVLVLTLASGILIARTLGPSGRGAVAVALSFRALLVQFGILGLPVANAYFGAREPGQLPRIVTNAIWTSLGLGTLVALAGIGLSRAFPALLQGLSTLELSIVLIGIPVALGIQLLESVLVAEGRMVAYNSVELSMNTVIVVGLAIGLLVLGFGVTGTLALTVAVNVAGMLMFVVLLRRHLSGSRRPDLRLFYSMFRYGVRLYLAALLAYLVVRGNLILVNAFLGGSAAGQFSVVIAAADALWLLPSVVALNLLPRLARRDEETDTAAVFRSLAVVYGLLCLFTVPLAAPLIRLLYGTEFGPAASIYYWLLPGIFAFGMVSVLSYHFAGRGFPLEALVVWFIGAAVNFAILIPLLSRGASAETAALVTSIACGCIFFLHVRLFAVESGGYLKLVPRPREALALVGALAGAVRRKRGTIIKRPGNHDHD